MEQPKKKETKEEVKIEIKEPQKPKYQVGESVFIMGNTGLGSPKIIETVIECVVMAAPGVYYYAFGIYKPRSNDTQLNVGPLYKEKALFTTREELIKQL